LSEFADLLNRFDLSLINADICEKIDSGVEGIYRFGFRHCFVNLAAGTVHAFPRQSRYLNLSEILCDCDDAFNRQ
jgi:hypothetical protein